MPKKILLADDSVTIQKVVELTFVDGDYQVTSVSNGKLAVQKIQQDRPDILLCDVIMPEMNGYDVAAFVKGNPAYSGIPVILLTGTFEPFDEEKAKASGADMTITKPFDSKMLVEKVEELIQRRMVFESTGAGESAQVFHSRQEFTLEAPPPHDTGPMPQPAPAEPSPFVTAEPEYLLPAEPSPSALEDTATSSDASGPVPVSAGFFEPLENETPGQSAPGAPPAPSAPEAPPPGPFDGVDLGPITEADALSESAFEDVLPPPAPPRSEEVVLPGADLGAPEVEALPDDTTIEEPVTRLPEPEAGAEDWGMPERAASAFEEPFVGELETSQLPAAPEGTAPEVASVEVVHALTDQQEMVSEAHKLLDHHPDFLEEAQRLSLETPDAVESSATVAMAIPPEPVTDAYPSPEEAFEPEGAPVAGEAPAVPMEASTALSEEAEGTELLAAAGTYPVIREAEETSAAGPDLADSLRAAAEDVVPGLVREALEREAPAIVRALVAAAAAEAVGEAISRLVPGAVQEAGRALLAEVLPGEVVRAVGPAAREEVRREVEASVPQAAGRLVAEAVPEAARTAAAELAPSILRDAAGPLVAGSVAQAVSSMAPGAVKEAVDAAVPEAIRAALAENLPGLVREALAQMIPEIAAREIRAQADPVLREVAWEVIPEMAESLIRRRIQELEAEAG
ncbi:MAG: response regulator [Acidobacteriota bacterium]